MPYSAEIAQAHCGFWARSWTLGSLRVECEASRSSSVAWPACFCWMAVCSFLITPLTPDSTARFRVRRFRAWRAAFRTFLWTTGMVWLLCKTEHDCYHGVCSEVKERAWRLSPESG